MDHDPHPPAQSTLFPESPNAPERPGVSDFTAAWSENSARNDESGAAEDRATLALEHRRMIRGLLLLGVLVLLASLARAGIARAFYSGWWRQW